ncbi:response regulator [Allochromatium vinosum]|uniref:histidine kinase n=1 Tax=Allochromatium vinosum (strain ATCC 17899 / DSM 180 / NBRC 103801 / NCIMB 10441 / D) TaxID=572477 RepID=D3RNQ8_ALLVD|nr:response regulator [Allochromatium vinosum]ADC63423.1 multi-sensor hybrid histidine kinase [Allochromatium vinosum DSM 180]MBK1654007.1 hypothetical protein [Allochromatium vinosum]
MERLNLNPPSQDALILIVDDDPPAIDALRRILRRGRYTNVLGCSSAAASLDVIALQRPMLVLLDLHMPVMDGFAVLAHIQREYLPEEAPTVLILTASEDRASRLRALESGARDYLLKPYDPYEVLLRVRNLLAIQRQGRMLANVLDSTPFAMLAHDAAGHCTYINRSALNLLGYERTEAIIGQDVRAILHDHTSDSATPGETGPSGSERWCRRADGTMLPVRYWSYPLSGERSTGESLVTLLDQSEHHESERRARLAAEKLETALRQADEANLAKSRFVANMSHEIRTPLTAITGFAETLTESDQPPEECERAVNAIIRNSRYLMELVNNILDFSRIESGKLLVEQIETPFETWIREIAAFAIERARGKGLHFDLSVEAPWPRTLVTDPTRAKQILVNLLNNAFKFTEQGSVRLHVVLDPEHERLVLEVTDTGIGIESHRQEELFEAFVQADASTMRQHGGSGLGLNIARTLARCLGGELSVRSVFGVGSRFTATLATGPIAKADLEHRPLHITSDQATETQPLEARTLVQDVRVEGDILLVDDHADNRDLLCHLLRQIGARVFTAENGQQGFERAQGRDFDLILMDMQMPVLDGLNATRLLRMSGFDGPIVALTANTTLEDRQAALEAGCNDFLTKPIDQRSLRETVVRYLSHSNRPRTPEPECPAIREIPGYEELSQRFRRELPGSLAAMRAARAGGDLSTVATLAHQLKGVGSSFGLAETTRLAGIIETRARCGETEVLPSLLNLLEESCQQSSN